MKCHNDSREALLDVVDCGSFQSVLESVGCERHQSLLVSGLRQTTVCIAKFK
jgi:hypothetical protein